MQEFIFWWSWKTMQACNFTKKEALALVFYCEFRKIFKNDFFISHLRWLLLWAELWFPGSVEESEKLFQNSNHLEYCFSKRKVKIKSFNYLLQLNKYHLLLVFLIVAVFQNTITKENCGEIFIPGVKGKFPQEGK